MARPVPPALAHVIRLPWQGGDGFIRGLVFRKEEEITFPSLVMKAGNGTGTGLSLVHLFQRISGSVPSEEVKRGRSGKWDGRTENIPWSIISTIHPNKKSEVALCWMARIRSDIFTLLHSHPLSYFFPRL